MNLRCMELGVDWVHKQRPAVLQIGDHGHAGDADRQLHPSVRRRLFAQPFLDYRAHMPSLAADYIFTSERGAMREVYPLNVGRVLWAKRFQGFRRSNNRCKKAGATRND